MVENYGDSELARRFGVTRYPAIFVDDVLVATPKDFGFYGAGEGAGGGRYAPLKSASSHERFRSDLVRMIRLILDGRKDVARSQAVRPDEALRPLPAVSVTGLDGKPLGPADLAGRVVLVEFWATWCPPCRSTLAWLGDMARKHGDRIAVVALAVESDEKGVRDLAGKLGLPITFAMGTPELARQFGDIAAVPTLFLFDRKGRAAAVYYGSPPGLHAEAEAMLAKLLEQG